LVALVVLVAPVASVASAVQLDLEELAAQPVLVASEVLVV
jgi:hypothetical protein